MNDDEFLEYIETTLIPDLRESGMEAAADDMERLAMIAKSLKGDAQIGRARDQIKRWKDAGL